MNEIKNENKNEIKNEIKKFDVKVLSVFTDKHTGKKYKKGDVIKGITEERFNEILKKGKLVEKLSEK